MRKVLVLAISFYQRFLSPHKGFGCAARIHYGSHSCSRIVKDVVSEQGLIAGRFAIRDQFRRCQQAARAINAEKDDADKKRRRRRENDAQCLLTEAACCMLSNWY